MQDKFAGCFEFGRIRATSSFVIQKIRVKVILDMFNKKNSNKQQLVYVLSLASVVVLLAGCLGKSKQGDQSSDVGANDTSVVLLKINGVPKITVDSLEADINEIAEMDQQLKLMMMFNPEETRERVFQEKKRMAVIEEWALSNGIRNEQEYQQKQAKIMKHVRMQLDFEQFLNKHKVDILDEDVLKYYNENKTQDPRILISQAGVKSVGVEFADHETANKFYHKLKHAGADSIDKLAKDHKYFVRNFGNVNEASYADQTIKHAVSKVTKFPSIIMVENQDKTKFWVVVCQSQEELKYHDFEKIKENLKQGLASKAIGEMLEIKIPEYAKGFELVENEAYFTDLRNNKKDLMQELSQEQDLTQDNLEQDQN